MRPKMTLLELLYLVAMEDQRDAKTALLGPPWPMVAPSEGFCQLIVTYLQVKTY